MLLKLKHYAGLSFWKRRHHHPSFPNAPPGCALTATTGLNVARPSIKIIRLLIMEWILERMSGHSMKIEIKDWRGEQ